MAKYVVVKTHNFDPETKAVEFDDRRKATAYLHWMWEECYNEEIANGSELDASWCYHEAKYGRIQWVGGDYTEFNLIEVSSPDNAFLSDWEKYVIEDATEKLNKYVDLMNYLDERAIENKLLNTHEMFLLNSCIPYDHRTELIRDIADANDCGECNTWNDLITALHTLFVSGERIQKGAD